MTHRWDLRRASGRRRLAKLSITLFILIVGAILVSQSWSSGSHPPDQDSPQVLVQASAMPNQGWAPLVVNFSAYGSQAEGAEIVRYEWDLDGNGRFDYDATSQGGYASYLYSKPGEYTVTLRVTDAQGRSAAHKTTILVRYPGSSSVDYWTVFDDSRVRRVDIRLDQAEWERMWENPEAKYQAVADAVVFGQPIPDAGFSMRGQFSLQQSGDKKPWKIDTGAFVDGQEYFNMRQLLLLNNIGDPTLLKEKLAYEMMAFAGLPASHTTFAELWIDLTDDGAPAVYWGVYTLVERVDSKFLANRFGPDSVGGNLYKASHAQRGPMNLVYYGERIEDYPTQNGQYAYGKMNNEVEADYSDVIALARVVDGTEYPSKEAFTEALEGTFNVDAFLRYMAVTTILDNWDTYPNTGNNYYLFNDPVSEKFQWIPWDLTWGDNSRAALFGRSGGDLVGRAPLFDQVFAVERYRRQYAAYVDLLLREWFTPENISHQAEHYHQLLLPFIIQSTGDKAFFGEEAMFSRDAFDGSWRSLVLFAFERRTFLMNALQEEGYRSSPP